MAHSSIRLHIPKRGPQGPAKNSIAFSILLVPSRSQVEKRPFPVLSEIVGHFKPRGDESVMNQRRFGNYLLVVGALISLVGGWYVHKAVDFEANRDQKFAELRSQYPGAEINYGSYQEAIQGASRIGYALLAIGGVALIFVLPRPADVALSRHPQPQPYPFGDTLLPERAPLHKSLLGQSGGDPRLRGPPGISRLAS